MSELQREVVPDFEIEISDAEGGLYRVSARSDAGEIDPVLRAFPYDDLGLSNQLNAVEMALIRSATTTRRLAYDEERPAQQLGGELFEFAFSAEVRAHFNVSRERANEQRESFRVRLRLSPPKLAALPWEFLYDYRRDSYLALSTPLVRYVDVPEPRRALAVDPPLRILGMVAQPNEFESLSVDREKVRLQNAVSRLEQSGLVRLTWVDGQTWWDLERYLDEDEWHILHFIGHGSFDSHAGEGVLAFVGEDGRLHKIAASDLALLLSTHPSLRLVVLNSCDSARATAADRFSSTASVLMRRRIPAVVAMQYEITDVAAITFARGFYTAIARQLPVEAAVTRARLAVKLDRHNSLEWATPVLFLRSFQGEIFDFSQKFASQDTSAGMIATDSPPVERVDQPRNAKEEPPALRQPALQVVPLVHGDTVTRMVISHDSRRLATTSDDRLARVWSLSTGEEEARLGPDRYRRPDLSETAGVAISPDALRLATTDPFDSGSLNNRVRLWDLATGAELATLVQPDAESDVTAVYSVGTIAFAPAGDRLVTAGWAADASGVACIWDVDTGDEIARLTGHAHIIWEAVFSVDGNRLATTDFEDTAMVWELSSGRLTARLRHENILHTVLERDGARAASCGRGDGLVLWDASSGEKLAQLAGEDAEIVHPPAFSPDGVWLAAASGSSVVLWELATRREAARLSHDANIRALAFSPDATMVATACGSAAFLWEPNSRRQLAQLTHDATVHTLAFSADGTRLATASDDNAVRVWNI